MQTITTSLFLDIQYNVMLFSYIINPVVNRCVIVSLSWSASTLGVTTKLIHVDQACLVVDPPYQRHGQNCLRSNLRIKDDLDK